MATLHKDLFPLPVVEFANMNTSRHFQIVSCCGSPSAINNPLLQPRQSKTGKFLVRNRAKEFQLNSFDLLNIYNPNHRGRVIYGVRKMGSCSNPTQGMKVRVCVFSLHEEGSERRNGKISMSSESYQCLNKIHDLGIVLIG